MYEKNTSSLHALGEHSTITPITLQTKQKIYWKKTASIFCVFDFQEASTKSICKQIKIFETSHGKSIQNSKAYIENWSVYRKTLGNAEVKWGNTS